MPVIPRYDERVRSAPLANKRANAFMTPLAAGAGFSEALQRVGTGVADVAEALDYKDQLTAKADSDAAYSDYMEHRRQVMYDPETGYLNQTGSNAMGETRTQALEEMARRREAVEQGLSPRALAHFTARANGVDEQTADTSIKHDSNQRRTYLSEKATAAVAASMEAAGLAYNDEEASQKYLSEAIMRIREQGALTGLPAEAVAQQVSQARSEVTSQRAANIAYEDPIIADQFLDANREDIGEQRYREMKDGLKPAVLQQKADRRNATLFAPGGGAAASPRSEAAVWQGVGLLSTAAGALGMDENAQNEALQAYLADGGAGLDPAKVAWCAAFVNATLGKQGLQGTSSTMARSFLNWGQDSSGDPQPGDIVVLERGKPPYGHVGFFQGYNDDGSLRIISGNSGDRVATGSYDADRVLGIRRPTGLSATPGTEPPSNDALAGHLEGIMSEPDLELRGVLMDNFTTRLRVRDTATSLRREALMDTGWARIVEGQNPDTLTPEEQIEIGPGGMQTLRTAYTQKITGVDVTDPATFQHMVDLTLSTDPVERAEFMELNLNEFADELSEAALTDLKTTQSEMREEDRVRKSGVASEAVYDRNDYNNAAADAREQFDVLVTRQGMHDKASARSWLHFTKALKSAMQSYADENGAPMPQRLLDQTVGALLLPITLDNNSMIRSNERTIRASAPYRDQGTDVEVDLAPGDVPYGDRKRLTLYLGRRFGRPPTEDEVVDHYEREVLHQIGLRPEIEYTDIPSDIRDRIRRESPGSSEEQVIDLYLDMMVQAARP